ncbi:hypothetical protein SODALDRAFT_56963 [Sodiomyces alkalinus F11]|uniref:Extensin domain-containing protein n=1 Tax=Sodiomyces alkalinus (strain CBS 110278 / VKM F-3762 / F11) TaxID=1314773 RepID=A0A3N2PND8_SODAK|nr:hypothetical protein SODALDRAFT_56963 [Sodiomyces alkalinus F11]ROT36047.1 hypothetical protein SODALDRAFT_56963 [Sodiomyces alkalinus F11]
MTYGMHTGAASTVSACSAHAANLPVIADEESSDVDEPPDSNLPYSPIKYGAFGRNPIRRSVEMHHQSLLTKALQSRSEEDGTDDRPSTGSFRLRRSATSNASLASTVDLTSDTGLTSPSRTNTPSPPLPELRFLTLNGEPAKEQNRPPISRPDEPVKDLVAPKKRRIQFACDCRPETKPVVQPVPQRPVPPAKASSPPPRKTRIKFAYPAPLPASTQNTPPRQVERLEALVSQRQPSVSDRERSRGSGQKQRYSRSPKPVVPHHASDGSACKTKKYITASDKDLQCESSRFHEFASDDPCHDDWILESCPSQGRKLTIDDTLSKENEIRKIAREAEEEADAEEDLETTRGDDDEDEDAIGDTVSGVVGEDDVQHDDEDDNDDDDGDDDDNDGEDDEDYDSVGYHTDEETGFAASDDENEDDGLQLWTPAQPALRLSGSTPVPRRSSTMAGDLSDSSVGSPSGVRGIRSRKTRRIKIRPGTPELPDSTDFVCGTLDEDLPMEDAYISCMAARRREKLHVIPQDIDPSFPASDPEGEGEEEIFNPVKHASDDEDPWLHGKMDDLHHEQDGRGRKKKGTRPSPKRYHSPPPPKKYHSPPPKRHHSPAPTKTRGRSSPHRLFDPQAIPFKELASRPGLTMTKSLPRAPALFPNHRHGRRSKLAMTNANSNNDIHVRGAIDIVKGLEKKRQRRREKFYQKYCNRARKGQIPERKPQPGMGYERMRELGLIMAGKIEQCNYVLSV